MSDDIDINNLAHLARIDIDEDQVGELKDSISDILAYVSSVEDFADDKEGATEVGANYNRLRPDTEPHEPGEFTDQILGEAPDVNSDNYIVVPPIL